MLYKLGGSKVAGGSRSYAYLNAQAYAQGQFPEDHPTGALLMKLE
jgi:hypothetical protein